MKNKTLFLILGTLCLSSVSHARLLGELRNGGVDQNISANEVQKFGKDKYLYIEPSIEYDGYSNRSIFARYDKKVSYQDVVRDENGTAVFDSVNQTVQFRDEEPFTQKALVPRMETKTKWETAFSSSADGLCRALGHESSISSETTRNAGFRNLVEMNETSGLPEREINWYAGLNGHIERYKVVKCLGDLSDELKKRNLYYK